MVTNATQAGGKVVACCNEKAIIVPAIAVFVDIGLPLLLLLASYIYLRRKSLRNEHQERRTELPLIEGHEQETAAVISMPTSHESDAPGLLSRMRRLVRRGPLNVKSNSAQAMEARLHAATYDDEERLMQEFGTHCTGLTSVEAADRLSKNGPAVYKQSKPPTLFQMSWNSVVQPFNGLMVAVAVLTVCPPTSDTRTFALIVILLAGAIILRFGEEIKGSRTAQKLLVEIPTQTKVLRDGNFVKIDSQETVVGDILQLSGNDIVPADLRILQSTNLLLGMATLTGEASPVQRSAKKPAIQCPSVLDIPNLALQGTSVISGAAVCIVLATGKNTYAGQIASSVSRGRQLNAFDLAVRRVVYVFIWFLVVMVPLVIILSGISTGKPWSQVTLMCSWSSAVALGLSVAVGLSPQMMPIIITANLSRGAEQMRRHDTIVRRLDAVQNLGSMSILCTDKTGTLTQERLSVTQYVDVDGELNEDILYMALLNASLQETAGNAVDEGIRTCGTGLGLAVDINTCKVGEIPFDFQRRMSSVIVKGYEKEAADLWLICKGAFEDVLLSCGAVSTQGQETNIDPSWTQVLTNRCDSLHAEGLRVLAVAKKRLRTSQASFTPVDESNLVFCGFIVFLDPPKPSVAAAVRQLTDLGVSIKVLTGDSLLVAKQLCDCIGIPSQLYVTGAQLAAMSGMEVKEAAATASIFAKVTPQQKMMIIASLQEIDEICGYVGDGTNDMLALQKADVGVCVKSGTDAAKSAADLILHGQDMTSIAAGIRIGRVTYGNTIKYIKFASSSSFGNTFSILAGAAWLPFNPLLPIQVLALNLLYNISQVAIPWDTMDEAFLKRPRRWSAKFLGLYMLIIGPTSSIFDMVTFLLAWYVFKANNASNSAAKTFTSIWFLESLMTQTFIVHLLRTEQIPFVQSRAAWPLIVSSFGTMVIGAGLCFVPQLNSILQLQKPPTVYYAYLVATVSFYCVTVQIFKAIYISVFNDWL